MSQIIGEDGVLAWNLESQIAATGIANLATPYHVVAIIGPQSSGKSTVLNSLFGTCFQVMDASSGRHQTTKGVHMASTRNSEMLIFDVEGSDSRERGDAEALFERKTALFSLVIAEVLIINVWESDVGRYQAAGLPTMQTVFEVNLELFLAKQEAKTKLLFLIRDFTSPRFEGIAAAIESQMHEIWSKLPRPDELQNSKFTDFFDLLCFPIHHKFIQSDLFADDIAILSKWFFDTTSDAYLFKEKSSKIVPGNGFSLYIQNLWDLIHTNQELNIPSQKNLLGQFKCEENARLARQQFTADLEKSVNPVILGEKRILQNFREICTDITDRTFSMYDESSWCYSSETVEKRRAELQQELKSVLQPLFEENCGFVCRDCIREFDTFACKLGHFTRESKWSESIVAKKSEVTKRLSDFVEGSRVVGFDLEFDVGRLESDVLRIFEKLSKREMGVLHDAMIASHMVQFEKDVHEILLASDSQMWDSLRAKFRECRDAVMNEVSEILETNLANVECAVDRDKITTALRDKIVEMVKDAADNIEVKMKSAFDRTFRYDSTKMPRLLASTEELGKVFNEAKKSGHNVLELYRHLEFGGRDGTAEILISDDRAKEALSRFRTEILRAKEEIQIQIEALREEDRIPPAVWLIFCLVCGDQLLKYALNPFYLILMLLFGGIGILILRRFGWIEGRFWGLLPFLSDHKGKEAKSDDNKSEGSDDSSNERSRGGGEADVKKRVKFTWSGFE
jgi:hypothetical protein